jgi:lipoprotein-anchoring transpeptidase ErfK/SrfK
MNDSIRSGWFRVGWMGMIVSLPISLLVSLPVGGLGFLTAPAIAQGTVAQEMAYLKQTSDRWIEVDLSTQRLIAWEGRVPVYAVVVSTGKGTDPTQPGTFAIQSKHRIARMRGDDYDVPDVPYTMYYSGGYAIHGAYWHHQFGTPVSHGCVNVAVNHARWLFNWADVGTAVVVHD